MKKQGLSFIILIIITLHVSGQYFVDIEADLTQVMHCDGSWFDKDDDGDLDLLLTGEFLYSGQPVTSSKLYNNFNRDRIFKYFRSSVPNVAYSGTTTGDFDNDGDMDFVITGRTKEKKPVSMLFRNNRNNQFSYVKTNILNLFNGDVQFGDFDRNGNLDVAICGADASGQLHTLIYSGNGKGNFSRVPADITGIQNGEVDWGDYDNDGDLDLLITGENHVKKAVTEIYRNENGTFVRQLFNLEGYKYSAADWGDYDNDGDLDFVITGQKNSNVITLRIYNNMQLTRFISIPLNLPGTRTGSVDWGDYDCDGDLDILITGESSNGKILSTVYRNDRNGNFTVINAGLTNVYLSDAEWGDYDNDGDLDLFLAGLSPDVKPIAKIYRNERIKPEDTASTGARRNQEIFTAKNIWMSYNAKRPPDRPYYYFMTSSCFCRPDSTYDKKDYHMFISEVFQFDPPFYHQEQYFNNIIKKHSLWGSIKGGHPSEGYLTKKEAIEGRKKFLRHYNRYNYQIHFVPWENHPNSKK